MKTLEQIEQELDAKIPRSVVSERDGGGGRRLSYLEGHYVIDRLNKIFGPLGWSKEITEVKEVVNKTSRGEFPAYLVKVRLDIRMPVDTKEGNRYFDVITKEAYGYGADKSSQNAHELAIKEAVTDALKVAAKDLGMSLGLALYDKEQTNVDDGEPEETPSVQNQGPKRVVPAVTAPSGGEASKEAVQSNPARAGDSDKLKTVIRSHVKAAIKKGVLTMEAMKAYLSEKHGYDNLDGVSNDKLPEILKYVQELTK